MEALVVLATCVEVGTLVCGIVKGGSEFYKKVKPLLKLLPVVGDALRQFDSDHKLTDDEQTEILEKLSRLEQCTSDVARDINEKIEWQTMKLQYSPAIERIKLGMEYLLGGYCSESNKADESEDKKHKREIFKTKLESLCANEKMALSVRTLIGGLRGSPRTGGDNEFADNIFELFYKQSVGNRPQTVGLAERMMQLLASGMLLVITVDTLKYGENGGRTAAETYEADWVRCCENVKSAIDRCTNNVKDNLEADIVEEIKKGGQKTDSSCPLSEKLSQKLQEKYDWLEHFVCVYTTKESISKYLCHAGDVAIAEVNGCCCVVFFRPKDDEPLFSSETMRTLDIIRADRELNNAQKSLENIRKELEAQRIGWWGLLCVNDKLRAVGGCYRMKCSFARDFGTHLNKFVLLR